MSEGAIWFIWLGVPFGTLLLNGLRSQVRYRHAAIATAVSFGIYVFILSLDGHWTDPWTPVALGTGLCFSALSALVAHAIGKFRRH